MGDVKLAFLPAVLALGVLPSCSVAPPRAAGKVSRAEGTEIAGPRIPVRPAANPSWNARPEGSGIPAEPASPPTAPREPPPEVPAVTAPSPPGEEAPRGTLPAGPASTSPTPEEESWAWEIERRLPSEWTSARHGGYLFLFDREVRPERVETLALTVNSLRSGVFEKRFPPVGRLPGILLIRVCKDKDQYSQYGGPSGSVAYYSPADREAVCHEDIGNKKDALRQGGIAFHQYLHHALGGFTYANWFEIGLAEYFGGFEVRGDGRVRSRAHIWRRGTAEEILESRTYVPLKEFVRLSPAAISGPNFNANVAQAWAFAWFLSEQKDPEWSGLLSLYFTTLQGELARRAEEPGDSGTEGEPPSDRSPGDRALDRACEVTFGGMDDGAWARLERAWLDFRY